MNAAISLAEGDIQQAVKSYETIINFREDVHNLSNYGTTLTLNGDYQSAINMHLKAVLLNSSSPSLKLNLADSYQLSGDAENANKIYQQVVDSILNPSSVQDYSIRAQALAHLDHHNEAIKIIKSAEIQFPASSELSYAAAIVHTLAGNHNAAIVAIEEALNSGTGAIWFSFSWFESLCVYPQFIELIESNQNSICR